jgi:hypothetical protein
MRTEKRREKNMIGALWSFPFGLGRRVECSNDTLIGTEGVHVITTRERESNTN